MPMVDLPLIKLNILLMRPRKSNTSNIVYLCSISLLVTNHILASTERVSLTWPFLFMCSTKTTQSFKISNSKQKKKKDVALQFVVLPNTLKL